MNSLEPSAVALPPYYACESAYVDDIGVCLQTFKCDGFDIKVSFYVTGAVGIDTQPLYSLWVVMPDGKRSRHLNGDRDARHPLRDGQTQAAIVKFVQENRA